MSETYDFSTMGTTVQECFRVETPEQGAALFEAFVQYIERENHLPHAAAEKRARQNLGYMIGYMEPAVARQKAYEMIGLLHPIQTGETAEMLRDAQRAAEAAQPPLTARCRARMEDENDEN